MKQAFRKFISLTATLLLVVSVYAQVTTSSMSGVVMDGRGPVYGATVIATHEPSGTIYGATTNENGRYSLNGMRIGGPYKIQVAMLGYGENIRTGVSLNLGETHVFNFDLKEEAVSLDEVIVSAVRTRFSNEKTGASTNINNTQMSGIPTVNRSISDIAKMSPYASGMSLAGSDGRSTNFTVDGSNFNNNFGLSSALPGGGNPISIDAIEEIQVVIAPFDVRQTNFIGGGINAITKSGTNTFKGTAYTYYNNQDMRGNRIGDTDFGERDKSSRTIYGATLGGPIIKNKLFFFANIESEKRPGQVVSWRPSANGVMDLPNSLSRVSIADMEKVKQHLINNYGYDPGSYTNYPGDESNFKILARIDWNISKAHKLSFRYNYTKNEAWNGTNGTSSDTGQRATLNRISQYGMAFSGSLYSQDNIVNSLSGELNSRFSDKISNQFLVTYSKFSDMRGSPSSKFPFIDILVGRNANNVPIIEPYISAGYELFTWNNGVNNKVFTITDNMTAYMNSHKITAGLSYEHQMANNSYIRNGTGYYRYASLDDFLNQAAPIDFALTYGYAGEQNPTAQVSYNQFGIYVQDEWNINPKFKLTYGVRADYLAYVDNLMANKAIDDLDYGGKKITTGNWPDAVPQFSPRIGFSWDVKGDQTLKVRGGTGIFTGRLPLVFLTNMPTNSGMVQGSYTAQTTYDANTGLIKAQDPNLAKLAGPMITDVNEMIARLGLKNSISPEDGALPSGIAAVDPGFKMPQIWKSSIALDYRIPASFPFSVTVEGIYTKNINAVTLVNYNFRDVDGTWERFSGKDNRYIYPGNLRHIGSNTSRDAFVLTNTNEGWGTIGNITLTAEPVKNMNLMAAYTYTQSKEISGMPGNAANSAYSGNIQVNGSHIPQLEISQYVVPHVVKANFSYRIPWQNSTLFANTTINIFYSGYSAGRYSYTYNNDMNGDGYAMDLIYIPANRGDIKFTTQADEDAFFKFMEQDKYLSSHKGQYAGAYATRAPWVHKFDLRFTRDLILKVGDTKNTLQFSLDFLNIGNLINSRWGVTQNMNIANNGQILRYDGKDAGNVPSFSFAKRNGEYLNKSFDTNYYYGETWLLQVGIKFIFN